MADAARAVPAGVLRIRALWGQQSGVLHDPEPELHHELVKEESGGLPVHTEGLKHTQSSEKKVSLSLTGTTLNPPLMRAHTHLPLHSSPY